MRGFAATNHMRWFRVRKTNISKDNRELFERFGAPVIGAILFGGFSGPVTTEPLKTLYGKAETRQPAAEWLTEQYDRAERGETWSITMEVAVTLFVAAELFFSILAWWRQPAPSAAGGRTIETATAATSSHWQRVKECAEQADRIAKRGWASDTADGYKLESRINHYSPKYDRCYVEVFLSSGQRQATSVPFTYSIIFDAFEGTRISSCVGRLDEVNHSAGLAKIWCDGDCAACRSFEKERMTN